MGRTGGMGGMGKGKIPDEGDLRRIRRDQGGKLGKGADGQKADVQGEPGQRKKRERVTLGSTARKLEHGGVHVGTKCTRTGRGWY